MVRVVRSVGVSLAAAMMIGCMSSGKKIEQSKVDKLQKGVTTRAQLEQEMGPPDEVFPQENGKRMLVYRYLSAKAKGTSFIPIVGMFAGGSDTRRQTFTVIVDKGGIVEDFELTDREGEARNFGYSSSHTEKPTDTK